jgi:hypothetical protein
MRLVLLVLVACATPRLPALELIETAPIETTLDSELPDAHRVWLDMIRGATRSIELGQFYASNAPHSRLEPIVAALEAAIHRGVTVRFVVEQSFVKTYADTLDRLATAGATVRHLDLGTGGILHAKYMIVDDREAFLGSQNFDWRALEHNLELGVRIRDAAIVRSLVAIFAADWAHAGGEPAPTATAPSSPLVASPRDHLPSGIAWDLPALVALIDSAHHTIHAQMLTYLAGDWTELEAALVHAAERGVDVELLVADWAKRDKTVGGLQRLARTPHVAVSFVTIPAWSGGFIPFARSNGSSRRLAATPPASIRKRTTRRRASPSNQSELPEGATQSVLRRRHVERERTAHVDVPRIDDDEVRARGRRGVRERFVRAIERRIGALDAAERGRVADRCSPGTDERDAAVVRRG